MTIHGTCGVRVVLFAFMFQEDTARKFSMLLFVVNVSASALRVLWLVVYRALHQSAATSFMLQVGFCPCKVTVADVHCTVLFRSLAMSAGGCECTSIARWHTVACSVL